VPARLSGTRRTAVVVAAVLSVLALAPMASAAAPWTRTGAGVTASTARTLGSGSPPTSSNVNSPSGNVTLSWSASALSNGGPTATGYTTARYDARTGVLAKAVACTASGTTSCSESAVPTAGTWQYAVTPKVGLWFGAASALSGDVNLGPPTPVALSVGTTNGGTVNKPDQGDTIWVQFSQRISVGTLCSTWAGNGTDQSVVANSVVTVNLVNSGSADSLTVATTAAACAGAPKFGTFALGGNYVSANRTCTGTGAAASTVSWSAATSTLTIRLGACGTSAAVATSTITYTPNAAVQNSTGTAITGTAASSSGAHF
jgi:hypothetical protein